MKILKFKSLYTPDDIVHLYKVCCVHSSMENNFGIFCIGAGMILRSVFVALQNSDPMAIINLNLPKATQTTSILMDGFEGAQRDISTALIAGVSNETLSENIKRVVEEARKIKDKMGR